MATTQHKAHLEMPGSALVRMPRSNMLHRCPGAPCVASSGNYSPLPTRTTCDMPEHVRTRVCPKAARARVSAHVHLHLFILMCCCLASAAIGH
eukprot:scaffold19757_cov113-Isochrysis_galbana.AAC.4